jgi:hypothetical protein
MSRMMGLMKAKILMAVATVLLKTDLKHFHNIDSCFSYHEYPKMRSVPVIPGNN